jgi:hypothetical protein
VDGVLAPKERGSVRQYVCRFYKDGHKDILGWSVTRKNLLLVCVRCGRREY